VKVVIPGGSGHVGGILTRAFRASGDDVIVLSRGGGEGSVVWDGRTLGPWAATIDGADVVINLAGRSVNCRYHAENRAEILRSRLESTRVVGEAIAQARQPPRVWLQASTATIYAHRYDAPNDEVSGMVGNGPSEPYTWHFSIDVATAWEQALDNALTPRTRKVAMRTAIVMAPGRGGPFHALYNVARFGLGGPIGDGRQFVSWIHDRDLVRATRWLIERNDISGVVNLAAPNPLPYIELMRALRRACGATLALPATKWMIEIAMWLLQSESELVLKSRRVAPGRLLAKGFSFDYPEWPVAARDLVNRSVQGAREP
jgi:uncharacterized protein (TIGR01777 family)